MRKSRALVLGGILWACSAMADTSVILPNAALFARCYGQITGQPVPRGHALLAAVKAGSISAIDACVQVFDKAQLGNDNKIATGHSDSEAVAVLNTFNNFHRSWFATTKIEDIIDHGPDTGVGTFDIYDPSEPALSLPYHLLKPSAAYSSVLTDSFGYQAVREENTTIKNLLGYTVSMPSRRLYGNNATIDQNAIVLRSGNLDASKVHAFFGDSRTNTSQVMPKIQVGDVIGVLPQPQNFTVPNLVLNPLGGDPGSQVRDGTIEADLNYSYNFYSSVGGGVLGQPIYLMMNIGHPKGLMYTGAEKLPRRWVYNTMQTFLCSQFPSLRESDVQSYLDMNGTAPFRKATSCLQCHATMDQAAMTARNIVAGGSEWNTFTGADGGQTKTTDMLTSYKVTTADMGSWPSSAVANYHVQNPTGKLYFRSVTGQLINQPLVGLSGLGSAMASTEDYYDCAAKRYFEFFTGISVSLYDMTDPRFASVNESLTQDNLSDLQFVKKLGANLRSTQSLRQMVLDILSSDYYKSVNFRP